jgi:hypothetical protein
MTSPKGYIPTINIDETNHSEYINPMRGQAADDLSIRKSNVSMFSKN